MADGSEATLRKIPSAIEALFVEDDKVVGPIVCDVVIGEKARRILISDSLASELGIVMLDLKQGLLVFKGRNQQED